MGLADQIRKARESTIEAGGYTFTVRRPTALQLAEWRGLSGLQWLTRVVVGWNVPEHELVPGGGGKVPPFDAEAFVEWAGDRPDVFAEIAQQAQALIEAHYATEGAAEKNS